MSLLSVLVANVRINLSESSANFFTDAEIKKGVGEGYRHYFQLMVTNGDGYFEATANLGFTSGTETVSLTGLASTFFKISQLERRVTNGTIPLMSDQRRFGMNITSGGGAGDAYLPTYKLRGTNIVLEPTPGATEAASSTTGLKLDYVYQPTFPSSSSADSFDFDANFPAVYEPMIELYATISCLEAKDAMGGVSDIQSFRNRLEKWEASFLQSLFRDETPEQAAYIGFTYNLN